MIDASKFYETFHGNDKLLLQAGFKRTAQDTYRSKNGVTLKLILDQWGWTPEAGWGFLGRLIDSASPSEGRPYQPSRDIRIFELVSDGLISQSELDNLYRPSISNFPKMDDSLQLGWISFGDLSHLVQVLETLMPLIAQAANDWDAKRTEERKKPLPPIQKRTPEEIRAIREQAEKDLRAAGLEMELPEDQDQN